MGGLAGIASVFSPQGGMPLPPLPGNLGLPEKSKTGGVITRGGRDDHSGFVGGKQMEKYEQERTKADAFNQSLVNLLNQQPHLNGSERRQVYDAYKDRFVGKAEGKGIKQLTDFSGQISQLTPDQFKAQQQQQQQAMQQQQQAEQQAAQQQAAQQQAAAAPKPAAAAPKPVPAPAPAPAPKPVTVGPTPKPVEPAPAPTPVVATSGGNIAGQTVTTGGTESSKGRSGRRGRMQTLLTGLGGAVERFGL